MSIEAMKQALEALENSYSYLPIKTGVERDADKAITELRQAIEFAEMVKKGTKAWDGTPDDWVDDLRGGVEPVAYASNGHINWIGDADYKLKADLYAAPPNREWVGLTGEDIDLYAFDEGVTDNKAPAWLVTYARGIEAKLKEKNHD